MDTNCFKRVLCVSVLLCVVTVLFPKKERKNTLGKSHSNKKLPLHDDGHLKVDSKRQTGR